MSGALFSELSVSHNYKTIICFQANKYFTVRNTWIACGVTPILCLVVYSWTYNIKVLHRHGNHAVCNPGPNTHSENEAAGILWLCLYCFVPTVLLVILQTLTIARTRKLGNNTQAAMELSAKDVSYSRFERDESGAHSADSYNVIR